MNIDKAIEFCLKQVDKGLETFTECYPTSASVNGVYQSIGNTDWTNGFWTGMIWLAYEFTGNKKYLDAAMWQVNDFYYRAKERISVDHHDMGFLYSPSCVAAYKLTGDETAKEAAILAADHLCNRYREKGQFLQAWGGMENYRLIIDCLLNIPLLFWATDITGDKKYRDIAVKHLNTAVKLVIRDDGSTYHTYFFNPETGEPEYGKTVQGYSDDSIWARGQAWGIYGLALAYKQVREEWIAELFMKVVRVFKEHLPADNVPAWDMIFTDSDAQKDSSAAAIAVCGILEMKNLYPVPEEITDMAEKMMVALQKDYFTSDIPESNGILKHAVYAIPLNVGIDECNIWGDYYFMEALMRLKKPDWDSYWD